MRQNLIGLVSRNETAINSAGYVRVQGQLVDRSMNSSATDRRLGDGLLRHRRRRRLGRTTLAAYRRGLPKVDGRPPLPVLRTPRKGWIHSVISCCLASFPAPSALGRWTAVGVEVERPERSEDERPRGRRGSAAYLVGPGARQKALWSSHLLPPVNVRQMSTLRVPAPSLIWVHGQGSGDMMMDGVPDVRAAEGVRPLILSGKYTQQRGGNRGTAGAGRGHQLKCGQDRRATHRQAATSRHSGTGSARAASPSSRRV